MSSRAVGGASAVGCGVFGVGGLLVGVALVVWLGSIALDGSTASIRGGGTTDGATTTAPAATETRAAVTVTPATDLGDGDEIAVAGTGFPPGPVSLVVCLTHAPAGRGDPCDETTATVTAAPAEGTLDATRTAPRVITVGGTAYDCAAAPGACSLRARPIGRSGDPGATAGLRFAAGLPPSDAEVPPAG